MWTYEGQRWLPIYDLISETDSKERIYREGGIMVQRSKEFV